MPTAIIIGAGPAGLTAAYQFLKETDIHPIIFEQSDMVGGISRTIEHNGNRIDIGGHRFFSKNDDVMKFWTDLMPVQGAPSIDDKLLQREKPLVNGGPDPERQDRVMLIRDRVSRIFFLRKFFDYPISLKPETFINMGFARTMKSGFGYIKSAVFKREEKSLRDFMINRFGRPLYEMFFEDYTEKVWGRNPRDLSPDWGAQRIKGLSLSKAVLSIITKPFKRSGISQKNVETSLIEQYIYPKKGPGQLWETLADEIIRMGGEIHFNSSVTEIHTDSNRITSVTVLQDGQKTDYSGDYYISSMPVKDLVLGMGAMVPESVLKTASELPYRDFITVGLLLNKLKIKNQTKMKTLSGIVPDCWIYIQERDVKIGRLQVFNNWSPYMVADPEHTVWVGLEYFCSEGDKMWSMPDQEFIDFAASELAKIGIIDRDDVLDAVRINVKKAYPAYFGSYEHFDEVKNYLSSFENLYCIGRNGQHRYNNMDHSMLTAMETVRVIQNGGKDRESIWNVNTEQEYHESKTQVSH